MTRQLLGTDEFDTKEPQSIRNISVPQEYYRRVFSGIKPLDNLFNGIVPGQVIALYAPRGCGKTTFLLQISSLINSFNNFSSVYFTNEETIEQLAFTARRVQAEHNIFLSHNSYIEDIIPYLNKYPLIVIDSLSGISTKQQGFSPSEIPVFALQQLYKNAKKHKTIVFFTLHLSKNKKTSIGKTAIEHIADAVIRLDLFEDRQGRNKNHRIISVEKNRMGSIGELCITMDNNGFDFTNVIEDHTGNEVSEEDVAKSQMTIKNSYKSKIAAMESDAIINIAKTNGKVSYNDLRTISNNDIPTFERLERRIKSLVKMGILEKLSSGEFAYCQKSES